MHTIDRSTRRRVFALAAALGAGALIAPSTALAEAPACPEDTLDRVRRTGEFRLGLRIASPPFGYRNAGGEDVGFATEMGVAIYGAVNTALGGKVRLGRIPVTVQTRVPLLLNGTIDIEAGASVITQARAKVVDTSLPVFLSSPAILVAASSSIKSLADLAGKRVGGSEGGVVPEAFRRINAGKTLSAPIEIVGSPTHSDGMAALETGSIDAYSSVEPVLYGLARKSAKWRVIDLPITTYFQAFLVRPESSKFKSIVNVTLAQIFASGRWATLYEKYFGPSSRTPMPMTAQLRVLERMNAWPLG
ncbi:MAG: transporter substrate-binding domain-containing protein [Acetobacteraceae bacterium]